jgi:dCMP deaminase
MKRASWDRYFLNIAEVVATRSTCDRKHVGAVIVDDRRITATGYNGSAPGAPHCDDVGHLIQNEGCIRTIHAEANAIVDAGRDAAGSTIYVTCSPCYDCMKLILATGIDRVVFKEKYRDERPLVLATAHGVEVVHLG